MSTSIRTVILAGGLGTRLSEETVLRPKPMVEIGGRPILWHIMKIYEAAGFDEFILALGYKGEMVKEYFMRYHSMLADLSLDLATGGVRYHDQEPERWRLHLVDTGDHTQTGGRIKRLAKWIEGDTFFLTYGDGVGNVDIRKALEFHRSHGKLATVTAVRPPSRFGSLDMDGDQVMGFAEKPQTGEGWINGGFFVLNRKVLDYIDGDHQPWEDGPMAKLTLEGQLMAYRHEDFWQPMDTLREKQMLEQMWESGHAPWKVWA
jgi:glucose-1-phosphate cytidylyltransferase